MNKILCDSYLSIHNITVKTTQEYSKYKYHPTPKTNRKKVSDKINRKQVLEESVMHFENCNNPEYVAKQQNSRYVSSASHNNQ